MPLYEFKCEKGHVFDRRVPLAEFDFAQHCDCGALARMHWDERLLNLRDAAGIFPPDSASVSDDRNAYFEHNITYSGGIEGDGVTFKPNSHSLQCGCEKCGRHRKRAVVTEVADARKEVRL